MKVIFSFISNRKANGYNNQYREIAALANFLVKKQHPGIETIFFGDKQSLEMFRNIDYNYFVEITKDKIEGIPDFLWTLGKFLAISLMNESFFHLDLDILLFRPLKEEVFNQDIVCFHNEHFSNHMMRQIQDIVSLNPCKNKDIPSISYNCAIFGGNDINTIKNCTNIVLKFVKDNSEKLKETYLDYNRRPNNKKVEYFDMSILAEQIWTFQLFKDMSKPIYEITQVNDLVESYDDMMRRTGYMHLISWGKDIYRDKIKNAIEKLNIKY